ncbi:DNA primase family protein [Desulfotignum balticum]|uniref:DNA primase family protein n=1 Tax=Desulfotignum balticum TaxID=115781 RepID=UPI00046260FF|nr:phage/plasmid primase, P4 family [Desulfotignum balticum]
MDEKQIREQCSRLADEEQLALAEEEKKAGKSAGSGSGRGTRDGIRGSHGGHGSRPVIDSDFIMQCLYRNELGDAELFKALYRDDFVFNKSMDRWMQWTGHHWVVDRMDNAEGSVEGVALAYEDETKRLSVEIRKLRDKGDEINHLESRRKKLNDRVSALRSTRRRKNCLMFAHTSADPMAIDGTEVDQKPWLLPCANGVLNLKTGEMEPGRQKDYLVKSSPVSWPDEGIEASSELWEKVLYEIFDGNVPLIEFMRRVCGYSLVGEVYQSVFVVMTGQGRNGKSMLVDMLCKVLGEMAATIRPEMLLDTYRISNSAGPSPDLMTLRGIRMAFASETDDGCKISPSKVKWLTGRDPIRARGVHDRDEVQWMPSHTLILLTNNKPHAPANDFAFWERMKLIPFTLSFVEDREPQKENERRADTLLYKKLEKDLPGIFAWMVRGCLEWQQMGLAPPSIVKAAVDEYKKNEDSVGDFIDECCLINKPDDVEKYEASASALYARFEEWWRENISNRVPKKKRFGQWMTERFEKKKSGTIRYVGIGLLDDGHTDQKEMFYSD